MKKMNKIYEAPVAEVIEMQTISSVLTGSPEDQITGGGTGSGTGNHW